MQVRIQDLAKGGGQLLRSKSCQSSEVELCKWSKPMWPGCRACLRAVEAFGVLMLKYAFSHIL